MKRFLTLILVVGLALLAACSNDNANEADDEPEELAELHVDFEVPETAEVGETIEVKATVTYGDELVTDADEVNFEYWTEGNKDDSQTVDSTNNGDGTYTAEITLEEEAVYSMYAHTTAKSLHTMPLKSVIVGEAEAVHDDKEEHEHVEGFHMHFTDLENTKANEGTDLVTHIELHDKPLEKAEVNYEIWNNNVSEKVEWIEAEEKAPGEYSATHTFKEAGEYTIQIHVENDELHEHEEYEVSVTE